MAPTKHQQRGAAGAGRVRDDRLALAESVGTAKVSGPPGGRAKPKAKPCCRVWVRDAQQSGPGALAGGLRFSMAPGPGESGFQQWLTAMQMVARLQGGIPPEFRRTLWLTLADKHLQRRGVDWPQAERLCFSEWSNPDDDELGVQIVKDLHRTGCSLFCGQSNQAVLKRVLLAYARWNKAVGYCQGFNMLAALILQVMDRNEPDSVKVMIYLIEGVLPESYFANNLRGLSVDMAVFRDLLRLRLPQLSRHLEHLQMDAGDNTGTSYEPPLTNVFTMQWFLTLFCNCLPQPTVLRVWDLIFLEGNQILLRTALAIWDHLSDRIMTVNSADEFYSIMGVLTREILEFGHVDSNRLIKTVVALQCPELPALRDKYMYNITPWTSTVSSGLRRGLRLFYTEEDSGDSGDNSDQDDDERIAVAAAFGIADLFRSPRRRGSVNAGGGGFGGGFGGGPRGAGTGPLSAPDRERERLSLDVSMLKQQYCRLRERQRQAHIIVTAACGGLGGTLGSAAPAATRVAMNHLLIGKPALRSAKGRRLPPPPGAVPPPQPPRAAAATAAKRHSVAGPPPRPVETIHWKDEDKRRKSLSLQDGEAGAELPLRPSRPSRPRSRSGSAGSQRSNSSSSSTSTELCDEAGQPSEDELGADAVSAVPALPQDPEPAEPATADLLQLGDDLTVTAALPPPPSRGKDADEAVQAVPADGDLMGWNTRPGSSASSAAEDQVDLRTPVNSPPAVDQGVDDLLGYLGDAGHGEAGPERPERVVASVTEKLRLIMEHLEHGVALGVPPTPPEDAAREASPREASPTSTSSRESRQRLMERLFGREGSLSLFEDDGDDASAASLASLKSSALELDLGELLDEDTDVDVDVDPLDEAGRRGRLGRQNSERASRIIRENSEILQRIAAWQRAGRSVTLPERSEPPDLFGFASPSPVRAVLESQPEEEAAPDDAIRPASATGADLDTLAEEVLTVGISADGDPTIEVSTSTATPADAPGPEAALCPRNPTPPVAASSTIADATKSDVDIFCSGAARVLTLPTTSRDVSSTVEGVCSSKASSDVTELPASPRLQGDADAVAATGILVDISQGGVATDAVEDRAASLPAAAVEATTTPKPDRPTRLSRTLSRDSHAALPLSRRTSLDETQWSRGQDPEKPAERLQLILDAGEAAEAAEGAKAETVAARTSKPQYKFPEMSPVNTSPLQPVPGSSLLQAPALGAGGGSGSSGQPRKWRPHLSPPSTPVVERALASKLDRPGGPGGPRPVLTPVALDAPTALPVQTPSLPREGPRERRDDPPPLRRGPPSPASPPSPLGKPSGRRKKIAGSPDEAKSPVAFNPFPSRTNIRQPKEVGVRLGLYPSSSSSSTSAPPPVSPGSSSKRT